MPSISDMINQANNTQKNTIRVNVWDQESVVCDACGHDIFVQAFIYKRIPGFLMGTGTEDHIQPVPVAVCAKCGELMPVYKEDIKKATSRKTPDSSLFI